MYTQQNVVFLNQSCGFIVLKENGSFSWLQTICTSAMQQKKDSSHKHTFSLSVKRVKNTHLQWKPQPQNAALKSQNINTICRFFVATPRPKVARPPPLLFSPHLLGGRKQGTFMFMANNVKGCRRSRSEMNADGLSRR